MNPKPEPIKREPSLVRFSREHHHGLLLVWKIREGLRRKIDAARIIDYASKFFSAELEPHFADEEQNLLPFLPPEDELRVRTETEHKKLRSVIRELEAANSVDRKLNELAQLLEEHIRFEERILFNHLQSILSKEQLSKIDSEGTTRTCRFDDDWKDQFWK